MFAFEFEFEFVFVFIAGILDTEFVLIIFWNCKLDDLASGE